MRGMDGATAKLIFWLAAAARLLGRTFVTINQSHQLLYYYYAVDTYKRARWALLKRATTIITEDG